MGITTSEGVPGDPKKMVPNPTAPPLQQNVFTPPPLESPVMAPGSAPGSHDDVGGAAVRQHPGPPGGHRRRRVAAGNGRRVLSTHDFWSLDEIIGQYCLFPKFCNLAPPCARGGGGSGKKKPHKKQLKKKCLAWFG